MTINLPKPRIRRTNEDKLPRALELLSQGVTCKDVAKVLGISTKTITRWGLKARVKPATAQGVTPPPYRRNYNWNVPL